MANLTYQNIVDIINGGGVVFLDCGGVPKLIDSIPDIPPDLTICRFVERNLSEYIIVGSPANGQIPAYNSTTSKLQWTTPASGGGAWGTITGTLSNQTDLQTALNLKASINTTDGILPYKSGSGTLADSPITRIDASTIQVAAINGGSGANDDITIQGTSNATRTTSYVNLQPNGGNVGVNTSTPAYTLDVNGAAYVAGTGGGVGLWVNGSQAIRSTGAGSTLYVDAGTDLAGTLSLRAATISLVGTVSASKFMVSNTDFRLASDSQIGWSSSTTATSANADTIIVRDAANTLAQRNGTNAQAFRLYNTYTDASNYERLNIGWSGNILFMQTANAGTGTARGLAINAAGDNLYLQTSTITRWRITTAGHLLAEADNAYDIGASGATRPRTGYFGTNVRTPILTLHTGGSIISDQSSGVVTLLNATATDFSRLQFGGATSSFPAIKRNGTDIDIRLADDTGYAGLTASKLVTSAANSNTTPVIQVNSSSAGLGTGTNGDLALFSAGFLTLASNASAVVSYVNGLAFATAYGAAVRGGFTMPANSVIGLRASNGGSAPSTTIGATIHAIPDSPTQLTADQNNYQAGTGRSMFYRLSSDASRSITGFNPAGGTNQDGELHYFINVGSNNIVLVNESASSTAGNRFLNVTGADITLATNEMAMLVYDNTSARWRVAKM